jgi:hypothetical protein
MAVVLGEVLRWPLFTGSLTGLLRRLTARAYLA